MIRRLIDKHPATDMQRLVWFDIRTLLRISNDPLPPLVNLVGNKRRLGILISKTNRKVDFNHRTKSLREDSNTNVVKLCNPFPQKVMHGRLIQDTTHTP